MHRQTTSWFVAALTLVTSTTALPLQMSIQHREKECLFEYVEQDEPVSFSVIVLAGAELKGDLSFNGPITDQKEISAKDLLHASDNHKFDPHRADEFHTLFTSVVDFEHLNPIKNRAASNDDEEETYEDLEAEDESVAERRARRARERKKQLEQRQRAQQDLAHQRKAVRAEGDPFVKTYTAKSTGWFRLCLTASWNTLDVEMDLRRGNEFGGISPDTGHVYTLEEKTLAEEENFMEEDTAEQEGIKEEDFQTTRDQLKTLRRLLADISNRQQQERHRIQLHSSTNEHSHSRMVLSSLFQTILFCAVTGYQVFTIRRWFKGAPVLG